MTKAEDAAATASRVAVWERHGQSLMLAVITTALISTVSILYNSNATQAAMVTEIRGLTNQVAELRGTITAMQLNYVPRAEFMVHMQRLANIEARVQR